MTKPLSPSKPTVIETQSQLSPAFRAIAWGLVLLVVLWAAGYLTARFGLFS